MSDLPALQRLAAICASLPEVEREDHPPHAGFRVRGKSFAGYLVNHQGNEGITGVICRTTLGENYEMIRRDPARYYRPAYMHHRGWVGVRVDTPDVDWDELESLIRDSYRLAAPRRLAATVS